MTSLDQKVERWWYKKLWIPIRAACLAEIQQDQIDAYNRQLQEQGVIIK